MTTHTITLRDYHPGEYAQFTSSDALLVTLKEYDDGDPTPDDYDGRAKWTLTGDLNALHAAHSDLLSRLASVTWDWYGLGGDDNCYDYWPNSMILAADMRDLLADLDPDRAHHHTDHAASELNRIYWLARIRYAGENAQSDHSNALTLGHEWFNDDILNDDRFGECPEWLRAALPR